jgi:hypothetical protein
MLVGRRRIYIPVGNIFDFKPDFRYVRPPFTVLELSKSKNLTAEAINCLAPGVFGILDFTVFEEVARCGNS